MTLAAPTMYLICFGDARSTHTLAQNIYERAIDIFWCVVNEDALHEMHVRNRPRHNHRVYRCRITTQRSDACCGIQQVLLVADLNLLWTTLPECGRLHSVNSCLHPPPDHIPPPSITTTSHYQSRYRQHSATHYTLHHIIFHHDSGRELCSGSLPLTSTTLRIARVHRPPASTRPPPPAPFSHQEPLYSGSNPFSVQFTLLKCLWISRSLPPDPVQPLIATPRSAPQQGPQCH